MLRSAGSNLARLQRSRCIQSQADVPARRIAAVKSAQVLAAGARMRASVNTSTVWPPTPWSSDLQGWLASRSSAAIEQALDGYAREAAALSFLNGTQDTPSAEGRRANGGVCGSSAIDGVGRALHRIAQRACPQVPVMNRVGADLLRCTPVLAGTRHQSTHTGKLEAELAPLAADAPHLAGEEVRFQRPGVCRCRGRTDSSPGPREDGCAEEIARHPNLVVPQPLTKLPPIHRAAIGRQRGIRCTHGSAGDFEVGNLFGSWHWTMAMKCGDSIIQGQTTGMQIVAGALRQGVAAPTQCCATPTTTRPRGLRPTQRYAT